MNNRDYTSKMNILETNWFHCMCGLPAHSLRVIRDNEDNLYYIGFILSQFHPWYKRIWFALNYIFLKKGWCEFDEIVLEQNDAIKLGNMLLPRIGNKNDNCRA